jgi:hypothetical protein
VVGYHREIHHFSEEKSTKNLPPRNTPDSFCRRFTPTKSIAALHGRYFSLWETHLENFMSRPNVIPTFQPTPLQNRGRNCVRSKRRPPYMSSTTSTYFFALTIRKHLLMKIFERSGRGQEPSRGHKFSILENFLFIRDFTSQTLASFPSDLVGVALVGATPLHLLSQTALPLKSPTGAFIAALRFANAVPPQTLLIFAPYGAKEQRVVLT